MDKWYNYKYLYESWGYKLILVAGIHGVGKTYHCEKWAQDFNIQHFSASSLISKQKKQDFGTNKKVENINKNQDFLISALQSLKLNSQSFLLDGHFCLLDKSGNVYALPFETFELLKPSGIILISDSVDLIADRLKKRDNNDYSLELLNVFQGNEIEYAYNAARLLNIPLFEYKSDEPTNELYKFIEKHIK